MKAQTDSRAGYLGALSVKGGSGGAVTFVLVIFVGIAVIGILAAIALPAYQDYTNRAKVAEAALMGRSTVDALTQHYRQTRQMPGRLEDLPGAPAKPSTVSDVSIDRENGEVSVEVKGLGVVKLLPQVNAMSSQRSARRQTSGPLCYP